jgi:hypothetical protein
MWSESRIIPKSVFNDLSLVQRTYVMLVYFVLPRCNAKCNSSTLPRSDFILDAEMWDKVEYDVMNVMKVKQGVHELLDGHKA